MDFGQSSESVFEFSLDHLHYSSSSSSSFLLSLKFQVKCVGTACFVFNFNLNVAKVGCWFIISVYHSVYFSIYMYLRRRVCCCCLESLSSLICLYMTSIRAGVRSRMLSTMPLTMSRLLMLIIRARCTGCT